MAKILHVDDDTELAARVAKWLSRDGYMVEHAESGEDALQLLANSRYEVLLLDWQLPGISGLDICHRYRKAEGDAWIIFLTGKGDISNKEDALNYGADDYMVKPFDVRELSARLKSALSKTVSRRQAELRAGTSVLDPLKREINIGSTPVKLTVKETAILEFLMRNQRQVFSTRQLFQAVWPSESESSEGTIRTIMHSLRKKLETHGAPDLVKTVLGSGYTIDVADAD